MKNIFVLFCSLCMVFLLTGCDSLDYRKAIGEQEAGNYSSAIDIFSKLGEYKDSEERSRQCNYLQMQESNSKKLTKRRKLRNIFEFLLGKCYGLM